MLVQINSGKPKTGSRKGANNYRERSTRFNFDDYKTFKTETINKNANPVFAKCFEGEGVTSSSLLYYSQA